MSALLPPASRVELAMICAGSALFPRVSEDSEAGTEGIWKHHFVEALRAKGVEAALDAVPSEYRQDCERLDTSALAGLEPLTSELPAAYDVVTGKTRMGIARDERTANEVYARMDLGGVLNAEVVVIDVKTGHVDVTPARDNWQLKSAAVALAAHHGIWQARVAVLYLREGRRAWWDIATLDAVDLMAAAEEMRALGKTLTEARAAMNGGKWPLLRQGPHCDHCPSRLHCPARTQMIRLMAQSPATTVKEWQGEMTPELAAKAFARLKAVKAVCHEVEAALHAFAKEQPIDLGGGKKWGPHEVSKDKLDAVIARKVLTEKFGPEIAEKACDFDTSKAAISRALRPIYEARKKLDKKTTVLSVETEALEALRAAGAITKETKTERGEYDAAPEEPVTKAA